MFKFLTFFLSLLLAIVLASEPAFAQISTGVLLHQKSNLSSVESLKSQLRDELADPFFNLVLKDHADVTTLSAIEDLIQPLKQERHTFVVDERIADPTVGQSRRSVLTYSGSNGKENLKSNVMLSVSFDSNKFPEQQAVEAWGWDGKRGRYNYYRLDEQGTGSPSWKFRGSSDNADRLTVAERGGTCMQCHINGAPIMKELLRPWNNWDSLDFKVTYLEASSIVPWLVAKDIKIDGRLQGAEELELTIIPSIQEFNSTRISKKLQLDNNGRPITDGDGLQKVIDGKTLLKPLFTTTEFNIISANRPQSGLHPFPTITTDGPSQNVKIPNSFFLNANLMSGSVVPPLKGLEIRDRQTFDDVAELTPQTFDDVAELTPNEYKDLIVQSQTKLGGRQPGDAVFAWLVPEPSYIDNDLIDKLMRQGVVTPEFVSAVMAIDLENPILSEKRQKLLDLIPDEFRFKPLDAGDDPLTVKRHPDELAQTVIDELERLSPSSNSPEAEFFEILKSSDPREILQERVKAYRFRLATSLDKSNPAARKAELQRLYDLAIARRKSVLEDAALSALNESGDLLFPLP
ncbi:hypothetical protein NDI45_03130 [Leptolyngbya sp. GB1-A1]|uniref:hypothetical protein n=1 Tax=Leptolyngbya sp. GB1-A1 TaxID=2933908 RepID=UPI003299CDF1